MIRKEDTIIRSSFSSPSLPLAPDTPDSEWSELPAVRSVPATGGLPRNSILVGLPPSSPPAPTHHQINAPLDLGQTAPPLQCGASGTACRLKVVPLVACPCVTSQTTLALRPCNVRRPPSSRPTGLAACTFRCSTTSPARPSSTDTTELTLHDATTHRARALQFSPDPSFKVNYFSKHFLYSSPPPSDDVDRVERI